MFMNLGEVAPGSTLYCPFATYNSSGASVTITGLAVTDIEIYRNGSVTQRASDSGYALLDTDGIDFDAITGVHGFSVDLSDNTDAGFYIPGSTYWIVVSTITVDSQTVTFGYYFTISRQSVQYGTLSGTHSSTTADLGTNAPANDISGQTVFFITHKLSRVIDSYNTGTGVATFSPSVAVTLTNGDPYILFPTPPGSTGAPMPANVTQFGGTAGTFSGGRPEVNTTHAAGTAWGSGAITAASIASDAITAAKIATGAIDADAIADNAIDAGAIAANAITSAKIATGAITSAAFAAGAIDAAAIAADAIGASELAADAVTEIAAGVLAAAAADPIDSNVEQINTVAVVGAGTSGDKWRA